MRERLNRERGIGDSITFCAWQDPIKVSRKNYLLKIHFMTTS